MTPATEDTNKKEQAAPAPETTTQNAPQGASQPAAAQQAPQKATQPGAVSKAWTDITGHPGWWKRVLLLMFMGIIPFLNFFVAGYLLKWASKTSNTESRGLPRHTFDGEAFVWGFLYTVLGILVSIAVVVITIILGLIPLVGVIIAWFFGIFAAAFTYLAGIRMIQKKSFTAAFDLSQIVTVIKKDPWHLFLAVFLPLLAVGIVCAAIIAVIAIVFVASNLGNLFSIVSGFTNMGSSLGSSSALSNMSSLGAYGSAAASRGYSYAQTQPDFFASLVSLIAGGGASLLLALVVIGVLGTFGQIWVVRAVAHWLRSVAPQWFEGKDIPLSEEPAATSASASKVS